MISFPMREASSIQSIKPSGRKIFDSEGGALEVIRKRTRTKTKEKTGDLLKDIIGGQGFYLYPLGKAMLERDIKTITALQKKMGEPLPPRLQSELAQVAVEGGVVDVYLEAMKFYPTNSLSGRRWLFSLWGEFLCKNKNDILLQSVKEMPAWYVYELYLYYKDDSSKKPLDNSEALSALYAHAYKTGQEWYGRLATMHFFTRNYFQRALMAYASGEDVKNRDELVCRVDYLKRWQAWSGRLPPASLVEASDRGPPINLDVYDEINGILNSPRAAYLATLFFGSVDRFAGYLCRWHPAGEHMEWDDFAHLKALIERPLEGNLLKLASDERADPLTLRRWGEVLCALGPRKAWPSMDDPSQLLALEAEQRRQEAASFIRRHHPDLSVK